MVVMKVTKLNLTNFRDARDLSLELDSKLNVFVGVNGSGKSTVLDAIAIMLSWAVSRIGRSGASGRPIMESDITNDKSVSSIQLSCEADSRPIDWKLSKNRKGHAVSEDKSNLLDLNNYTIGIQSKISETLENVNLPLFVYYPVNRAVIDIPFRIRGQHKFDLLAAYNHALTSAANFRTFFEWFREREDLENEKLREVQGGLINQNVYLFSWEKIPGNDNERLIEFLMQNFNIEWVKAAEIKKIDDGKTIMVTSETNVLSLTLNEEKTNINLEIDDGRTDKFIVKIENHEIKIYQNVFKIIDTQFIDLHLEAVRSALSFFLPEFSNFAVRRSPLRMEVEKNGKRLTVNQLSGGEKSLIAMIGDLARRMAIANPASTKPLLGSGIVLIDEIDLHLHPGWQQMIVPRLLNVFPNCQFIISTHSPSVITHVKPHSLFLLTQTDSGIVAKKPTESYGKNVDRVLEDLMGLDTTRPIEVDSDLKSIFETINDGKLKEAQKMIAELKQKIGADPELVRAGVLIKRRELIGK